MNAQRQALIAGLAVLERFSNDWESAGPETLSHTNLLLLRSAKSLMQRLEACLDADIELDPSILSPADVWTVTELMNVIPSEQAVLSALRLVVKQLGRVSDG